MGDAHAEKIIRELMEGDEEFYDKYLSGLTEEELQRFLDDHSEFMSNL